MVAQPQGQHVCGRALTLVGLSQEPQGETALKLKRQAWGKGEPDISLQEAEAWGLTWQGRHVPRVTAQRPVQEAPAMAAAAGCRHLILE